MMTNLFDYEMLARQKSEMLEAQATQRRMEDQSAPTRRVGLLARLLAFRVRFGATEPQAVASRPA